MIRENSSDLGRKEYRRAEIPKSSSKHLAGRIRRQRRQTATPFPSRSSNSTRFPVDNKACPGREQPFDVLPARLQYRPKSFRPFPPFEHWPSLLSEAYVPRDSCTRTRLYQLAPQYSFRGAKYIRTYTHVYHSPSAACRRAEF